MSVVNARKAAAIHSQGLVLDGGHAVGAGRVTVVDERGWIIYDTFIDHPKTAQRTPAQSRKLIGLEERDLKPENDAQPAEKVMADLQRIIDRCGVLIGHLLLLEMDVLRGVSFKEVEVRDIGLSAEYEELEGRKQPSLADLSKKFLDREMRGRGVSSSQAAKTVMRLYLLRKNEIDGQQAGTTGAALLSSRVYSSKQSESESEQGPGSATRTALSSSYTTSRVLPSTWEVQGTRPSCVLLQSPPQAPDFFVCATETAPGQLVALPNIAQLAKGRVFDYRTSTYSSTDSSTDSSTYSSTYSSNSTKGRAEREDGGWQSVKGRKAGRMNFGGIELRHVAYGVR